MEETTYTVYHKCGTALSRPLSGGPITPEQLDEIFNGCICANCPDPIESIIELEVRASNLNEITKEETE